MIEVELLVLDNDDDAESAVGPLAKLGFKPQFYFSTSPGYGWDIFANKRLADFGFKHSDFSDPAHCLISQAEFQNLLNRAETYNFDLKENDICTEFEGDEGATIGTVFQLLLLDHNPGDMVTLNGVTYKFADIDIPSDDDGFDYESL